MKSSRIRRRGPTARTYGFRGAGSCSRASALFIRLLPQGTTLLSRAELEKAGGGYSGVGGCAKRLKCVELAPAFESPTTNESASKLDALHTLREVRLRLCRLCCAALYRRFPIGRLGNVPSAGQVGKSRRLEALQIGRLEIDCQSAMQPTNSRR